MKKTLSILLSFMLVFMSVGPLPTVFAASFSGKVTGSEPSQPLTGTVTISTPKIGSTLKLYRVGETSSIATSPIISGAIHIFRDLNYGKYYVTEAITNDEGQNIESERSEVVHVQPPAVSYTVSPNNPRSITVSQAIPGAMVTLSKDDDGTTLFDPRESVVSQDGRATFDLVTPGINYHVIQTVNGVDSNRKKDGVMIRPDEVKVIPSENAGPSDNQGTLTILESKPGNTIRVYYKTQTNLLYSRATDLFGGLKAGVYYVTQVENGAESLYTMVTIADKEAPVITLIGDKEVEITIGGENYPYKDFGATAKDNIDNADELTKTIIVNNPITADAKPGIYKITYNVTDSNGNAAKEVERKVTILPKTVEFTPVHTHETKGATTPDGRYGQIIVNNVYPGAIIYLYQDPNGKLIRTIEGASSPNYTINDVPVGKDYYVIQEFTNENKSVVKSVHSNDPIEVKDTTKPIIQLKGAAIVDFVMGDTYIEYGATAIDNVDLDKLTVIIDSSNVKMNAPGIYTVTYNVTDSAKNIAKQETREVRVLPQAPIAIGSNADLGEISVKNAYPGAILKLYNVEGKILVKESAPLAVGITTYVFKNIPPGSYYVAQEYTINGVVLRSADSNIVDVVDTNRPYITITGSENLFLVWDKTIGDYIYNKDSGHNGIGQYTDPGATATDYLDDNDKLTENIKRKIMFGDELKCDDSIFEKDKDGKTIFETTEDIYGNITFVKDKYGDKKPILTNPCSPILKIDMPGVYTITYSVTTERGTKADDKIRTITVAPPKVSKLTAEPGKSTIEVDGIFIHAETILNLYNAYGQLIEVNKPGFGETATFKEIPAGLGYYVTQTVNGIESAPSDPINVSLFEDAKDAALITAFEFATIRAFGTIDQKTGQINILVPKGTTVTNLKAKFSATGTVKVNNKEHISGHTVQDFTDPVKYTVTSLKHKEQHKDYTVTVTVATLETNAWTTTVSKPVSFSSAGSSIALSAAEKLQALEKGVSFIGKDRAIHIPAANVVEANTPSLTVKTPATYESNTSDPDWGKVIQQPTEINWGNSVQPFMQPIEVEIPKPKAGKSFARIVRENNQLFAITQLSEIQGDNMIGLATEPGTYAVIDDIAQPVIKPTTEYGKTTYQITTTVPNAKIYYTTNSSHIAFDRSARRSTLNNYSLDSVPDFTSWNVYEAGEQIAAPSSGELYAFVMKDKIISPLTAAVTIAPTEWKKNVPTYSTSHVLKVTFNTKVDRKALYSGMIYVVDDSTGKPVDTKLSLSADRKTISIAPDSAYTRGNHYTLHIDREFKGNTKDKQFLKQPLTQTFVTK